MAKKKINEVTFTLPTVMPGGTKIEFKDASGALVLGFVCTEKGAPILIEPFSIVFPEEEVVPEGPICP